MKKEILFRGKGRRGNWHYGGYASTNASKFLAEEHLIIVRNDLGMHSVGVNKKTVGQYIGRHDDKDNQIFEDDIAKIQVYDAANVPDEWVCVVCWNAVHLQYVWREVETGLIFKPHQVLSGEIIGNIHDNPELLDSAGIQREE